MSEHQKIQQSGKPDSTFQKQAALTSQPVSHPASIIQRARINPKSLTAADVLQLQRTIGNRAVGRLLSEIRNPSKVQQVPIQRQEIPEEEKEPLQGMFGKEPEEETCPSCVQRQEKPEEEETLQGKFETIQRLEPEEEEKLQMKSVVQRQDISEGEEPLQGKMTDPVQRQEIPEEEEPIQGKMIGTVQRQEIPEEEEPLQKKSENNTGMPDNLKAGVENLSGIDMSDVKVHYNSSKPAEVGALAYTQGTNIHVAPGQERHLPHEAWHVVQQVQGRVQATTQMKGLDINDDPSLEHEADIMGAKTEQLNAVAYAQGTDSHVGPRQDEHLPHEAWHMVQQTINTKKTSLVQRMKCKANIQGTLTNNFRHWDVNIEGQEAKNSGKTCNSTLEKLPQTSHIARAVGTIPRGLNGFRLSPAGTCAEPHAVALAINALLEEASKKTPKPKELAIRSLVVKEAEPTSGQVGHWLYHRWTTAEQDLQNQELDENAAHERDANAYYGAEGYQDGILKSPPAARRCPVCAEWMKTDTWKNVEVPLAKGSKKIDLD